MSRASNSLTVSDVITTPVKLKYTASFDTSSYYGAGIRFLSGVNGNITISGSVDQRTLNYVSVRHLFYSNYLTGSIPQSASYAYNWEQSTAASGTYDDDRRRFPTGSGEGIKIISVPREVFGQKISRNGFRVYSSNDSGLEFDLIDDGNGNLLDMSLYSSDLYVDDDYFNPDENPITGYVTGPAKLGEAAGNIIYSQGLIILTDPYYAKAFDAGPLVFDQSYTYFDTDDPKSFSPLLNAIPDSSPIDTGSLTLIPIQNYPFPNYTITTGSVTLDSLDPLYVTPGTYYSNYNVLSQIGSLSNTAKITVNIIPNCPFGSIVGTYYISGSPLLVFDFQDVVVYANSGSTVEDLTVNNNDGTFVIGNGTGSVATIQGYTQPVSTTPGYLSLPGGSNPSTRFSIKIPDTFKFAGITAYTFVTWMRIRNFTNNTVPGIVSCWNNGGSPNKGHHWYYMRDQVVSWRYPGIGAGAGAYASWYELTNNVHTTVPLNEWLFLFTKYTGTKMYVGSIYQGAFYEKPSTWTGAFPVVADSNFACLVGYNYPNWAEADFGYFASYGTGISATHLLNIYTQTVSRY